MYKKSTIFEFALPLVCIVHRSKKAGRLLYASTFLANSALFAMKSDHYNKFSFGLISGLAKRICSVLKKNYFFIS